MWTAVEFEGVTIRTADDRRYRGTVVPVNPSTHVNPNLRTLVRDQDNMEVRIDARVFTAADTRNLGIEVGDFVFLDPRVEVTGTGFIRSRHLDDKLSVACMYGAFRALRDAGLRPAQDTHILIANYEEVGHGGASGWTTRLNELLAVDMAAIGDGQTSTEYHCTICIKDGSGPYHYEMNEKLRRLAVEHNIPVKYDIYPYYSSDGSAYWRAGGDAKVALIGPGVESSHAYERTHQDSIRDSAHLIARYLVS
jgi:putative aminopeptidase FrvX